MASNQRAWIALLALVPACFHVSLDPVPRNAGGDPRIAAYHRLRPAKHTLTVTVQQPRGVVVSEDSSLALADGTDVHHADDLLPVVGATSPTARAARRSRTARQGKWFFAGASVVAVVAGAFLAFGFEDEDLEDPGWTATNNAGFALVGAGLVMGMVSHFYFRRAEEHARRASFATYDDSLRESLRLCVDGLQIVDCRAGAPGASAQR